MCYRVKRYIVTLHTLIVLIMIWLFVWGYSSHSGVFHSYGDAIIASEGLQILTYVRHSWPFSSKGSLACHTYCDTWHLFLNRNLRGPVPRTPICLKVYKGFKVRLNNRCVPMGDRILISHMRAERSTATPLCNSVYCTSFNKAASLSLQLSQTISL